jgi:hypothetical protein
LINLYHFSSPEEYRMRQWTLQDLFEIVEFFDGYNSSLQHEILEYMNRYHPPERFNWFLDRRRQALLQMNRLREMLTYSTQEFPNYVPSGELDISGECLKGFGIVFTAGGEGERLKTSLLEKGIPETDLENFTKATFGLPGFHKEFGTLHINLAMIASLCRSFNIDIPVVVTTGPKGSVTARVIPEIIHSHNNFELKHLITLPQDERLFLSNNERVVFKDTGGGSLKPLTHPDETGGPLMKLKQPGEGDTPSVLDWFASLGCCRTIAVQATALYHPALLPMMAASLGDNDCLGVGILRTSFPENDPYGTYVTLRTVDHACTVILEQDVRNVATRSLTDETGHFHLPFNTGFYAFTNSLLSENDLPDFATPPKALHPDLSRAPKIGYAAVDLIALAKHPVVLTTSQDLFRVLKKAEDLEQLSGLGRKFGLDATCGEIIP